MSLPGRVSGIAVLGVCCVLSNIVGPTGIRIQAGMKGWPFFLFFLEGIGLAPGVGAGRMLICSMIRSMTEACGRHLHATSCQLLQHLLVSTPLSLSLSDTQTPPPTKTVKSLPKKRHLSISPLLPLSWIFQSHPFPLLLKDLPGYL